MNARKRAGAGPVARDTDATTAHAGAGPAAAPAAVKPTTPTATAAGPTTRPDPQPVAHPPGKRRPRFVF